MEIVGVALGVVPILVMVAKSCHSLSEKLDTLKRRDKVARRLWMRWKGLQARFRQDCLRLLRPALVKQPGEDCWELLKSGFLCDTSADATHADDAKKDLRAALEQYLQRVLGAENVELCADYLREISELLDKVQRDLSKVESMAARASAGKKVLVLEGAGFALNKEKHELHLEELRSWISDFSELVRSCEACESQRHSTIQIPFPLPSSICAVRDASAELYGMLEQAWSCANLNHQDHRAGILVTARVDAAKAVHMDLSIAGRGCRASLLQISSVSRLPETRMLINVQSISIGQAPEQTPKRRKLTKKNIAPLGSFAMKALSTQNLSVLASPLDLHLTTVHSICCHLSSRAANGCRGYLGPGHTYKHVFFKESEDDCVEDIPLSQTLKSIPMGAQLKMAHLLARAVLQYNSTPWLPSTWRLKDFSVSTKPGNGMSDKQIGYNFDNVHVNKALPNQNSKALSAKINQEDTLEELGEILGVRNWSLCNLGIALIELACQKPISEMRLAAQNDDVVTARRIVKTMKTPFGFKYCTIVRRCLFNDFVPDVVDLKEPQLQAAVYNEVVKPLEGMIADFEKMSLNMSP